MSFVRRCETPSTRELGTFDELLRKSAGLAQIIVDNARAGELGKYVVTNILQCLHGSGHARLHTALGGIFLRWGGGGAIFCVFCGRIRRKLTCRKHAYCRLVLYEAIKR